MSSELSPAKLKGANFEKKLYGTLKFSLGTQED